MTTLNPNGTTLQTEAPVLAYGAFYGSPELRAELAGTTPVAERTNTQKAALALSITSGASCALLSVGLITGLLAYLGTISTAQIASVLAIAGISAVVIPSAMAILPQILIGGTVVFAILLAVSAGLYIYSRPETKNVRNAEIAGDPNAYMKNNNFIPDLSTKTIEESETASQPATEPQEPSVDNSDPLAFKWPSSTN